MTKSDSDNWQRIQDILCRAFEMNPADRASFVAAECGDDVQLRSEVEHLLRSGDAADEADFMDEPLCRLGVIESSLCPSSSEPPNHRNGSVDAEPPTAEPVPNQIDRYAVIRELGSGAFGTVVLAHDPKLDRNVAVKVQRSRFVSSTERDVSYDREGRILAKLDHAHIVPVYDTGQLEDGRTYVVSKFIEGTSLAEMLLRGKFAASDAALLIANIADALQHAHRKKLVHRDVKPANILLDAEQTAYLSDFGLTLSNEEFGNYRFQGCTPAYASPEQAAGEGHRVNGQSDIFSLGVVFYEMLTGERPFQGKTTTELLERILTQSPRPPRQLDPSIPAELERICLKALARRATDRFTTAYDLVEDLRLFLASETHVDSSTPRVNRSGKVPVEHSVPIVPKGLQAFDANDADFFLNLLPGPTNRDGLPECIAFWKSKCEGIDELNTFSLGLIYGPSGCGKTSMLKAGLLPRLDGHVVATYVAATSADTEHLLEQQLLKKFPQLDPDLGLVDVISVLRHDGYKTGTKCLLIIDQFEQWLHAHPDPENTVLANALRQCDGQRVQCILLVRDDFWMGITEFARILEVQLIEGHNSQAVDCFRPSHAQKVLTDFGRAYGDLPDSSKPLSAAHEQFLELVIDQLAEDGKVACIRLALLAQMMQGKPWTPAELEKVGGATGIGIAFLEETFSRASAPAPFRYHEKAARRVLKALLPEIDLQIKGQKVSRDELFEQSGYRKHLERFNELMQILDGQLRLVTPSDWAMDDEMEMSDTSSELSYQLTHDYLVPSIREWLSRKQKETWQGRAELCLDERAAQFHRSAESRYLPSPLEYLAIRSAVPRRKRSAAQQRVMHAATKRYGLLAILVVVLACLGCLGLWEINGRIQARRIVDAVMVADSGELSSQIDELDPYRRWARGGLRKMSADDGIDPKLRLRASLAIASEDPKQIPFLRSRLTDCSAEELPVILETVRPHLPDFQQDIWADLENRALPPQKRFQAGVALAAYVPDSEKWQHTDLEFLFERITAPDSDDQRKLIPLLAPISNHLVPFLVRSFHEAESEVTRVSAANALMSLGVERARLLAELSSEATSAQYNVLFPRLASMWNDDSRVREALVAIVKQEPTPGMREQERVQLGRRRASAGISLINLGEPESAFAVFDFQNDPEAMTQFLHRAKDRRLTIERVIDLLDHARQRNHDMARFALLLTLGEFGETDLPGKLQEPFTAQLVNDYKTDPSSAIHSATGWLLRQWGFHEEVLRVDHTPVPYDESGLREWYVEQIGGDYFTFVVFRPGEFVMGSPEFEANREDYELQHQVKLTRTIAVCDREFTRGQTLRHITPPDKLLGTIKKHSPSDEHTIGFISWSNAVQLCRQLTRHVDGLTKSDDCYSGEMTLTTNKIVFHPDRKGIRLPTEAEWEYVCRSGTNTTYGFGSDRELLDKYAWFVLNEGEGFHVGAELRPNLRGLFDMHGNAFEWCHDRFATTVADAQDPIGAGTARTRVIRGGGWKGLFLTCRSANRMQNFPSEGQGEYGFRIVRTLDAGRRAD